MIEIAEYREKFRKKAKVRQNCGDCMEDGLCAVRRIICPLPFLLRDKEIKRFEYVCTTAFERRGIRCPQGHSYGILARDQTLFCSPG